MGILIFLLILIAIWQGFYWLGVEVLRPSNRTPCLHRLEWHSNLLNCAKTGHSHGQRQTPCCAGLQAS